MLRKEMGEILNHCNKLQIYVTGFIPMGPVAHYGTTFSESYDGKTIVSRKDIIEFKETIFTWPS